MSFHIIPFFFLVTAVGISYQSCLPIYLFFRTTQDPRLDNDVAVLHVAPVLVPVLDDAGKNNAVNFPAGQVLLVFLPANVFHGVWLKKDLLMG